MTYYHGTDKDFRKFSLNEAQEYKDFGKGIYLSVSAWHAEKIAMKKNGEHAYVRKYNFDIEGMKEKFNIKEFRKGDIRWVKFVIQNRNTIVQHDYDLIIGPTADAAAQELMEHFYRTYKHRKPGRKDYAELISKLQIFNYPEQVCIVTQNALDYIEQRYMGIYDLRDKIVDGEQL